MSAPSPPRGDRPLPERRRFLRRVPHADSLSNGRIARRRRSAPTNASKIAQLAPRALLSANSAGCGPNSVVVEAGRCCRRRRRAQLLCQLDEVGGPRDPSRAPVSSLAFFSSAFCSSSPPPPPRSRRRRRCRFRPLQPAAGSTAASASGGPAAETSPSSWRQNSYGTGEE